MVSEAKLVCFDREGVGCGEHISVDRVVDAVVKLTDIICGGYITSNDGIWVIKVGSEPDVTPLDRAEEHSGVPDVVGGSE